MTTRCEDYPCCGHTDGLGCNWTAPDYASDPHLMCDHEAGVCDVYEEAEPECDDDPDNPAHDGWSWNHVGVAECDWCGLELPQHEPDGAPNEQWEVTTPPEVYMTDDEPDWNPWP